MRKFLLSLVFAITAIAVQAQEPAIVMTTTKSINSQFSFGIDAVAPNTPIQIDWGNGVKESFTIGDVTEFFNFPLKGSSVKIWGEGIASLNITSMELTALDVTRATSLTYLYIKTNQLPTLDLSNCTALTFVDCSENLLTSLNLPSTSTLVAVNCDNNLLTSLNVSGATGITELTCTNNKLTFATLPIKQPAWTTYTYSPQQNATLPKQTYSTNEEIDLSSQLTAGSNSSTYVWKTASGTTLVNGTDYNEVGGKFSFLKTYTVSLYCEMTNATFPSLTLKTTSISVPPTPSVIMTTTKTVGSSFSFDIGATTNNTPIQVDWGNGTLASYPVGNSYSNVSGTLAGNTIKIYGVGIKYLSLYNKNLTSLDVTNSTAVTSLNCQSNQLTALDVSNNTGLISLSCNYNQLTTLDVTKNTALTNLDCDFNLITTLDVSKNTEITSLYCHSNLLTALDISNNTALTKLTCYSNKLTFAALPLQQPTWTIYTYSPQAKLTLPKTEYALNEEIDLSSQLTAGGNTTTYVWKTISGATLVKDVDYTESNGKFTFIKQPGDYFYCEMRNATFPELTLATENISITQTEPSITMITTTTIGSTFSFNIGATSDNTPIQVDWGNGALASYKIETSEMPVSGTLAGNTIKIYGVGINNLNLYAKNLTSLDVSNNNVLTKLNCYSNQLTALDVSNNTRLTYFSCGSNQLTAIDVTKNTALTYLYCSNNQLTALDVIKNTVLTRLWCYSNQLNTLDVTKNTALAHLNCSNNQLTALDVTNNTALTNLDCSGNQLTALDVTNNTALIGLDCSGNQLTASDVTHNTALNFLDCSYNLITALDLTNNTELYSLYCSYNQLTTLDLTNNLTILDCTYNQLTTLDLTNNTKLTTLSCYSNRLTSLDVTKNTALTKLYCDLNHLAFSTLPIKQTTWTIYNYYPQNAIALPKKQYSLTETVDLSSELTVDGKTTNYIWKTKGGATLVAGTDYNVTEGVTTFLKVQTDSVYCQMTNATFPDLTLTTSNIKVSEYPLSVGDNKLTISVYPNPATDNFTIKMAEEIVRVEVYTITGVKVFENGLYSSTTVTVPLSSIPKGALLIKAYTRNGVYSGKVVKI